MRLRSFWAWRRWPSPPVPISACWLQPREFKHRRRAADTDRQRQQGGTTDIWIVPDTSGEPFEQPAIRLRVLLDDLDRRFHLRGVESADLIELQGPAVGAGPLR